MADKKITELTAETSPNNADLIPIVTNTDSTAVTKKITVANLMGGLIAPEGFLINGKIVPSVTSGNLTVAIKGLDGNNPSSTNPVYVRIGDAIRSITSALSVTKNAGTNWFNAGSSELATKEIDYFVYLGYNATDGVVIGFSRIPYATEYSQFSTTSTNGKYCAISTITNATSGDDYVVIGRFAATLSAGAGYTWTVPTFTSINLIQRPTQQTRILSFVPRVEGEGGSAGTYAQDTVSGYYSLNGYQITLGSCLRITKLGSWTGNVVYILPIDVHDDGCTSFFGRQISYGALEVQYWGMDCQNSNKVYWSDAVNERYTQYSSLSVNDMFFVSGSAMLY
jgi:hypothetical protein